MTLLLGLCVMVGSLLVDDVEFLVEGNESFSSSLLLSELQPWLEDIEADPQDDGALDDAAHELTRFYDRNGFPRAQVSPSRARDGPRWVVTFQIREGPQRLVNAVVYSGVHFFEENRFEDVMPWKRRGILGTGEPIFSPDSLQAGLARIRLLYRLAGFLDVAVSAQVEEGPTADQVPVDVTVTIEEGSRYSLSRIEIVGDLSAPRERFLEATGVQPGVPYTPRLPLELSRRLARWLAERGHFSARVEASVEDGPGFSKTVILTVTEGARATVGTVTFVGNQRTNTTWLRRRLSFASGDLYRRSAFEESRRALFGTGLFKNVIVEAIYDPENSELLNVTIRVEEKDAIRMGLQIGFGSYELGRLGVKLTHRNLIGRGWEGRVNGKVSFRGEEAKVSLRYPFLFEHRVAFTVAAAYLRFEEVSFERQRLTGTVGLEIPVETTWLGKLRLTPGYQIRDEQIHDPDVSLPVEFTEDSRAALLFLGGLRDTRDSILTPTRGSRLSLRSEYANGLFGSELDFVRLTGGATRVWSIAEDWQFLTSLRAGWIRPLDSNEVPLSERFFLGGSRTVRSFAEDELGPKDLNDNPIGGEAYVLANLELRYPIWRALGGAAFLDAGSLARDDEDFAREDYRYAAGGGLILDTPIGPFRVDAAATLNRGDDEDSWAIHVLFGHPF